MPDILIPVEEIVSDIVFIRLVLFGDRQRIGCCTIALYKLDVGADLVSEECRSSQDIDGSDDIKPRLVIIRCSRQRNGPADCLPFQNCQCDRRDNRRAVDHRFVFIGRRTQAAEIPFLNQTRDRILNIVPDTVLFRTVRHRQCKRLGLARAQGKLVADPVIIARDIDKDRHRYVSRVTRRQGNRARQVRSRQNPAQAGYEVIMGRLVKPEESEAFVRQLRIPFMQVSRVHRPELIIVITCRIGWRDDQCRTVVSTHYFRCYRRNRPCPRIAVDNRAVLRLFEYP